MLEFEPRSLWLDHHPLASELSCVLLYRVNFDLIRNLASSPVSDVSLWSRPAAGETARLWKRGDIFGPYSARGLLSNFGQVSLPLWASVSLSESEQVERDDRRALSHSRACEGNPHPRLPVALQRYQKPPWRKAGEEPMFEAVWRVIKPSVTHETKNSWFLKNWLGCE